MRALLQLARGKEAAEWERQSTLMAFIANLLRMSENAKVWHPRDLNPFAEPFDEPESAPQDAKAFMASFHAGHSNMPIQRMKLQEDGTWIEVKD